MIHRERIKVATDLIAEALNEGWDRERLKKELYKKYSEHGISPFRGIALPPDILDKELSTLYVVAKYGLGMDEELKNVFDFEERLEKAAKLIIEGDEEAHQKILEMIGPLDSNVLARIFRVIFTGVILGFISEDEFIKMLHNALKLFPDFEKTIRKYARFYIAFRTAEAIAKGQIRNKIEKEAFKQSLALRLGIPKVIPDDNYVETIAREVFKVPDHVLRKVLKLRGEKGEGSD